MFVVEAPRVLRIGQRNGLAGVEPSAMVTDHHLNAGRAGGRPDGDGVGDADQLVGRDGVGACLRYRQLQVAEPKGVESGVHVHRRHQLTGHGQVVAPGRDLQL